MATSSSFSDLARQVSNRVLLDPEEVAVLDPKQAAAGFALNPALVSAFGAVGTNLQERVVAMVVAAELAVVAKPAATVGRPLPALACLAAPVLGQRELSNPSRRWEFRWEFRREFRWAPMGTSLPGVAAREAVESADFAAPVGSAIQMGWFLRDREKREGCHHS
jgi:hypothetical protein